MSIARITFAPTEISTDAYYMVGMRVPDAFVALEHKGKYYAVANALELGNLKNNSRCDKVFSLGELREELTKKGQKFSMAGIIALAMKKLGAREAQVGDDFPAGFYIELKKIIKINVAKGALFPERALKDKWAQGEIRKANKVCAAGIALCGEYIRKAKVGKGKQLTLNGKPLTSQWLRIQVQKLFIDSGVEPKADLIIAGGRQACDPHCLGMGALKAGELIIVDLFAPLAATHYWGDMTRTFIKGTPTDAQARMVQAVFHAQQEAIGKMRAGIDGEKIHRKIEAQFVAQGWETQRTTKGYVGFFHGTGHSLGLDCHDMGMHGPRISREKNILRAGEVYTVEPGLYYPQIGGCRIEDNGVVTQKGFQLLSKAPYSWIL